MRRRLNYTDRKRIPQNLVSIARGKGDPATFAVDWKDLGLPASGSVYVEAYSSGSATVLRFPWGTVGTPRPPSAPKLTEIGGENVCFDLKVVDETQSVGRILGSCRKIRPRADGGTEGSGRQSILPVNPIDLGEQVWRISFAHDWPWLEVNKRVPGIMEFVRTDIRFGALVFPHAIRQILTEIVLNVGVIRPEDTDAEWQASWLRWGMHWHPDRDAAPDDDDDDKSGKMDWIETVVESFCKRYQTASMFGSAMQNQEQTK